MSEEKTLPIDLSTMPLEDIDALMEKAREYKRKRQTNPVLVKGYVDSVRKHRDALLTAISKMLQSEGVSKQRWSDVEDIMRTLSLDSYKENAQKIKHKKSSKK